MDVDVPRVNTGGGEAVSAAAVATAAAAGRTGVERNDRYASSRVLGFVISKMI
jgi:hypothetical protein